MKRGKDDEKNMEPMFPRLHVNDTEKGGPRAPPRNKMALYEQLSIPSQRFNPGLLPHNTSNSGSLVPPTSTSQGSSLQNMLFPSHVSHLTSTNQAEKIHTGQHGGASVNAPMARLEPRKKVRDEDDFLVPVFVNSETGLQHSKNKEGFDGGKARNVHDNDPNQCSSSGVSSRKEVRDQSEGSLQACSSRERSIKTAGGSSTREKIDGCAKEFNLSPDQGCGEIPASRLSGSHENDACLVEKLRAGRQPVDNGCTDDDVALVKVIGDGTLSRKRSLSNSERNHSVPDETSNDSECHEDRTCGSLQWANGDKSDDVSETSVVDTASGLEISPDDVVGIIGQKRFWKARRAIAKLLVVGIWNKCYVMEHSNMALKEGEVGAAFFTFYPEVLRRRMSNGGLSLELILIILVFSSISVCMKLTSGCWILLYKYLIASKCISQQRVFAVQVFELHRLIKVQRLIAGLPHLLLEDTAYLSKPSYKDSPGKKLPPELIVKPVPQNKLKDEAEKLSHKMECSAENAVGRTSLSSVKNGSQPSNNGPFLGNPPPSPANGDNKMNPWCFNQMLRHQWLVPVMSPSEGLIYKPYPGPGFMGSACGGCGPFGQNPMTGNFMTSAYGAQAPPHQGLGVLPGTPLVGHSYFPPHGMPVMNPAFSGSSMEQMNQFAGAGSHAQSGQLSGNGANFNMQQQSSSNLPSKKNVAIPPVVKFQASKDTEQQRCTASSPGERAEKNRTCNAAEGKNTPLILTAPANPQGASKPNETDQRTRVIRVVPHNPRSATESAARIFQSIQKERKRRD
ncbi:hypothetical protein Goshw_017221 [Gossypium schwendimanii]|uniref:Early flowering 3 n=1 Tax=Gossypium schwendimanii TaxID=34291 RepID=A0A7J9KMB0_GOSSC|nr:hypothetical protein [Gossypium schwendimanii]